MFLHSVCVQKQTISADGIYDFDLAVNPLSVVIPVLRPLNETSTLSNYDEYKGICQAFNRISILYRGESIISMKGEDAAALAYFRHGCIPFQNNGADTDNDRRAVPLPIFMGRFPYDKRSCFPATRRGELVIEMDIDVADTGYDNFQLSVETIEVLDANPAEYEKKVQVAQTFNTTGDVDVDLPPGNLIRGMMLFGTTAFVGPTPAPTWGRIKVLLDNQEALYSSTDWEVASFLHGLQGRQPPYGYHAHRVDATGSATQQTTATVQNLGFDWRNYAFLDFDPTMDDGHSLDTRNRSRFHVRANAGAAEAVRVVPIEVINLSGK